MNNDRPLTLIIFGATGDLSLKKLIPALYEVDQEGGLPSHTQVVGVSRENLTDESFRERVCKEIGKCALADSMSYVAMDLSDTSAYKELATTLESAHDTANYLFYFAVPPQLHAAIIEGLKVAGLTTNTKDVWRRVVVEKPFGSDLQSAKALNNTLASSFEESQIFRTDHYLGKDMVQNIIAFRFSNVLFEHVWDSEHIESIHVRLHETKDVSNRGSFYEQVGALRDVGQNHMLQLLALILMDSPTTLESDAVSKARANALESLSVKDATRNTGRGQYEGYRDTEGVSPQSDTETYFAIRAQSNADRWKGTTLLLEGGKAMPENRLDVTIQFKRHLPCVCNEEGEHTHANTLTFRVKPEQGVAIDFWAKKPGLHYALERQTLGFSYAHANKAPDAYAHVLKNAIDGERMVFPSAREIELAWQFVDPIRNEWGDAPFTFYTPGTCPDATLLLTDE